LGQIVHDIRNWSIQWRGNYFWTGGGGQNWVR